MYGVAGAVISHPDEARFTIVIDEKVADGNLSFYRFTVAEEFAHLKLHRKLLATVTSLEEVIQLHEWERYSEIDRHAKWLASALLIPRRQCLRMPTDSTPRWFGVLDLRTPRRSKPMS